jgi:mono/diheme cytochrome c family protein
MIANCKITHRTATIIVAACFFPLYANAQEIGDAEIGHVFATKNCAQCHAVEPGDESSPNFAAPSFTSVAKTSGMTGRALAAWFDTSHPSMPNFVLHTDDRDNVIAYIMSLKNAPEPK